MSFSGLPALAIDPAAAGAKAAGDTLGVLGAIDQLKANRQILPSMVAAQQATLGAEARLAPLKASGEALQYGNNIIATVAQQARAADNPADASAIWDKGMKEAAENGVNAAGQYVGHYRPDLADKLGSAFGASGTATGTAGAAAPGGAATNPEDLSRAVAALPAGQVTRTLGNLNRVITGFNNIKDAQTWSDELAALRQAGIPVDNFLPSTDYNPMNYAAAYRAIQNLKPMRDAMAQRAALEATGAPVPVTPPVIKEVGGGLYAITPQGTVSEVVAPKGRYQFEDPSKTMGAAGSFNTATGRFEPLGGGLSLGDLAGRIAGVESGGNANATNPRSTATGAGQFLNGTWLTLMKENRPDLTKGKSDADILALRTDPALSAEMIQDYAKQNAADLTKAGLPVTSATLYLAHGFGAKDAARILQSDPSTPMKSLFPAQGGKPNPVLAANPQWANMTTGQIAQSFVNKVGNDPVGAAGTGPNIVPGNTALHGNDYLKSIPDQALAAEVRAMVEGRMQQPSSFFLKTPQGQQLLRIAAQYDPNFDLSLYNSRVKTQNDLATGTMGKNISSFNTAIGHLQTLNDSIDALNNSSYPDWNKLANMVSYKAGDTRFQVAEKDFLNAKNAVVDELTRAFRGTGGNVHDIVNWENSISEADSPEALHRAVQSAMRLLNSRIEAIGDQYNRGMRTSIRPTTLLSPHAQQALAALGGGGAPAPNAPAAAGGGGAAPHVTTRQQFDALQRGSVYIGADGKKYRKP